MTENLTADFWREALPSVHDSANASQDHFNHTPHPKAEDNFHQDPRPPQEFMYAIYCLRFLTSIASVFGNSLTIISIAKFTKLNSSTNILIASLATADLIGGLLAPFYIIHEVYLENSDIFIPMCLLDKWLSMISTRENIQGILLIAIDRYIFIAYPFRYPLLVTKSRVMVAIIVSWIFGIVEISLIIGLTQKLKVGTTCKYFIFMPNWVSFYFTILVFIYVFITVGLYAAIARIAIKQTRAIEAQTQTTDPALVSKIKKGKKISVMMFTVLGIYLLGYLPSIVTANIYQHNRTVLNLKVDHIATIIFWVNIWANPIIYAWKSHEFKSAFKKLLGLSLSDGSTINNSNLQSFD